MSAYTHLSPGPALLHYSGQNHSLVILDEVEAALDEANVKRFGDYLNRFDKSSQFIVVTHRKGTMSATDAIYGVTMQESGVSKIVSVKLKDIDKM